MVAPGACARAPVAGGANPDAAVRLTSTRDLAATTTGSEESAFDAAPLPGEDPIPHAVSSQPTARQIPACFREALRTRLSFRETAHTAAACCPLPAPRLPVRPL